LFKQTTFLFQFFQFFLLFLSFFIFLISGFYLFRNLPVPNFLAVLNLTLVRFKTALVILVYVF